MTLALDRESEATPGPPFLTLRDISKSFGPVHALQGVDLAVRGGEVHALVGENGAGKSTLIAIAAGVHQPDRGEIVVRGVPVRFGGPADAEVTGISVVYQELSLIGDLDVAQNIYLHREPRRGNLFLDRGQLYARCQALLDRVEVDVDPHARVGSLSVAQRQLVEIAKALSRDAALVFMDEPTASLTSVEQGYLFKVIDRLRATGTAVVYVSHRLDEIFRIADTVTVLKDGRLVRTMPAAATNHTEMVRLMVGRELADDLFPPRRSPPARSGVARLSAHGISSPGRIDDISLDVWPREIVGLAGLIGSGRTSLLRAIFGMDQDAAGKVLVDGVPVGPSPAAAIASGIGLVSEDRTTEGLALDLTNLANLVSTTLPSRWGFYQRRVGRATAQHAAAQTGLAATAIDSRSGALSGGNQQKVVIGKWLATSPRVLLCDEPTRGIDVNTKADVYKLLRDLAETGMAILLSSSELPEVLGMADRVLVLREGRLVAELPGGSNEEDVMQAAAVGSAEGLTTTGSGASRRDVMDATVAVVQMDCTLGEVDANLQRIEVLGRKAVETFGADLVVYPECATTGYFVGSRARVLAEPADGPTNARLARFAAATGAHLAVGVIESDGDDLFDLLALFSPSDGLLASYRKVHLFSGERAIFRSGDSPSVVDTALGRVGLSICYDLMFPEYVRGLALAGATLVINGTDWITDAWQIGQGWTGPSVRALVQVRALENGIHVAMADRVGEEAGFASLGYSTIAGPTGAVLATLDDGEAVAVARVTDPTPDLERWRSYASYLADRRPGLYGRMGLTGAGFGGGTSS